MPSFFVLMENMMDREAMGAIRTGSNVREDFWEDFIRVCNNAEGVAKLLGVRTEQVIGWAGRIKHNLKNVKKDSMTGDKPKKKMLITGEK